MDNRLVSTDELMEKLGCKQQAKVEQWLKENKIRYFHTKKGIITTMGAIESRLLGVKISENDVEF